AIIRPTLVFCVQVFPQVWGRSRNGGNSPAKGSAFVGSAANHRIVRPNLKPSDLPRGCGRPTVRGDVGSHRASRVTAASPTAAWTSRRPRLAPSTYQCPYRDIPVTFPQPVRPTTA